MRAFHGDEAVKQKYLDRVREHREADRLIRGIGWEQVGGTFKGCAVGCTLESYDHSRYPVELGIPEWLAYLEDRIFEGLPFEDAMEWPEAFLEAIPVGADLEPAKPRILARILREVALPAVTVDEWGVRDAIERVAGALTENPGDLAEAARAAEAAAATAGAAEGATWAAWAAWAAGDARATAAAGAARAARAARAAAAAGAAAGFAWQTIRDIVLQEVAA